MKTFREWRQRKGRAGRSVVYDFEQGCVTLDVAAFEAPKFSAAHKKHRYIPL
jgi:hypothetical protein